jgi:DNA-binding ferritin-like protein
MSSSNTKSRKNPKIRKTNHKRRNTNRRKTGKQSIQAIHNSTNQNAHIDQKMKAKIIQTFFEMINTIRLYHWSTTSYAQHKATDELYTKLNEKTDEFVETLLGKDSRRVHMLETRIDLIDVHSVRDLKIQIHEFREFLMDFNILFDQRKDSDLLSLRDEILGILNQFLYFLTFK